MLDCPPCSPNHTAAVGLCHSCMMHLQWLMPVNQWTVPVVWNGSSRHWWARIGWESGSRRRLDEAQIIVRLFAGQEIWSRSLTKENPQWLQRSQSQLDQQRGGKKTSFKFLYRIGSICWTSQDLYLKRRAAEGHDAAADRARSHRAGRPEAEEPQQTLCK